MYVPCIVDKALADVAPQMHSVRRQALAGTVSTALQGAMLTVTSLGRCVDSRAYEKHRIKCVDRLMSNRHLYAERVAIYTCLARRILCATARPLISVDWSNLDRGKKRFLLRASVALQGRAFTLYEEVHPREQFMKPKVERAFVQRLAQIIEPTQRPILITDAGFHNPWRRAVLALGWDYIGRVRGRVMVAAAEHDDWQQARSLFPQASSQPKALSQSRLSREQPLDCQLVLVRQRARGRHDYNCYRRRAKGHYSNKKARAQREPWLLVTSLALAGKQAIQRVVRAYRTRMQIEEAFRDLKSERYGFGQQASRSTIPQRIELLLLIATLAVYLAWLMGLCAEAAGYRHRYQANTVTSRRVLSTVFLGRRAWQDRYFTPTTRQLREALNLLPQPVRQHADGF